MPAAGWANAFEEAVPPLQLPSYGADKTVVMTQPNTNTDTAAAATTKQRPASAKVKSKSKSKAVSRPPRPSSASNTTSLNLTGTSYETKRLSTSSNQSFYRPRAGFSASGLRIKRKEGSKHRSKKPPARFGAMGFAEGINMREIEDARHKNPNDNACQRYNTLCKSRSEPVLQRYVRQPATTKATSTNYRHTANSSNGRTAQTHKGAKAKKRGAKKKSPLTAAKARPPRAATASRVRTTLAPSSLASGCTGGGDTFAYGPYYPSTADLGKGYTYHRSGGTTEAREGQLLGGGRCRAMPDRMANRANTDGQLGTLITRCEGAPDGWRERGRAFML